ncbi:MAG TPA: DUF1549 domain-containing protein, partial [Prosthecobacter sp.]|nr:DUF1549 domain-containing protein [Prosthecobacter sp.]
MRLVLTFTLLITPGIFAAEKRLEFNRDVRPILASKCYACHGPDEEKREGDLRLDMRDEHLDAKEFNHRISTADPDDVMPPPKSPKPLTGAERDLLRRWVAEGAEYQDHWAFLPIKRPAVPASPGKNPIDAFIEAKLAENGLQPAPEAKPITLIRRLCLDLIGLPPTPSDLSDLSGWSDEKCAALVDRLLASPQFGERWARHWLDAARYADSNGFLGDGLRPNAYRYRDWVIDAVNRDLPFDQFTIEQIA